MAELFEFLSDPSVDTDVFFQVLDAHKRSCQREGRYDEAEITKQRIAELRELEEASKKTSLKSKHNAELEGIDDTHQDELEHLRKKYEDSLIPSFNATAEEQIRDLDMKQAGEMEALKIKHADEADKLKSKAVSPELMDMQRRLEVLTSQGDYEGARKLNKQYQVILAQNESKVMSTAKSNWQEQSSRLLQRHEREMGNLREKLENQRQALINKWKNEMQNIDRKYGNAVNQVRSTQRKQSVLFETTD